MYSVRSVLGVRRFCSVGRISSVRKFSLIENSSAKSGEKFLPIYKNGERINIEVTQSKIQKDYYPKKMNTKLGSEL